MKIRKSFVTNSSSSSYVVIMLEEDFNEYLNGLNEWEKEMIAFTNPSTQKLGDVGIVTFGYTQGNYDTFEDFTFSKEPEEYGEKFLEEWDDAEEYVGEMWYRLENKFPEGKYITECVDM